MTGLFLRMIAASVSSGAMILLLLLFSAYLSRRYEARWRYPIWIVLAVWLILPVQLRMPFGRLDIGIPARLASRIQIGVDADRTLTESGQSAGSRQTAESGQPVRSGQATGNGQLAESGLLSGNAPAVVLTADESGNAAWAVLAVEHVSRESDSGHYTVLELIAAVWLAGAVIFWSVHVGSYLHYRRRLLTSDTAHGDADFLRRVSEMLEASKVRKRIRIVRSANAESPLLLGFLRPVLVLPDTDYGEEELFYILKHESVHLKRGDVCVKLLLVIANALHWFNPLIWLMRREAESDMELSCDEKVMRKADVGERKDYAEILYASLCRRQEKKTCAAVRFYGGKGMMKRRFANILRAPAAKGGPLFCVCAAVAVLTSGMLVACSVQKPEPERETVKEYYRTDRFGEHLVRRETVRSGASEVEVLFVWDEEHTFWSPVIEGGALRDRESGSYIALCEQGSAAGTTVFGVFCAKDDNLDEWEKISELRASGQLDSFERKEDGIVCHFTGGTGIYESTYLSRDAGVTWELLPGEPDV